MIRLLVTGSRRWTLREPIRRVLVDLPPNAVVIVGDATGADTIADEEARAIGLKVERYPADWPRYGKGAGPIRNQQMIDAGKPTRCAAFPLPGSIGTWDMVRRCKTAGVPVEVVVA